GLALGWLIYTRLISTTGWFAFVVVAYLCAMLIYAVVTLVGNSMVEVKDRVAAALIRSAAFTVMLVLALILGYTFWAGHEALQHWNFFTNDLSRAGPL